MPSIVFLLVCGDILRAVRTRLYEVLEPKLPVIAPVDTTSVNTVAV